MGKQEKSDNRKRIFDETVIKALGNRIRELRKQKNLSQQELSFRSGLILSQIGRIEIGSINPTLSTLSQISKGLDVTLKELFDFEITD